MFAGGILFVFMAILGDSFVAGEIPVQRFKLRYIPNSLADTLPTETTTEKFG